MLVTAFPAVSRCHGYALSAALSTHQMRASAISAARRWMTRNLAPMIALPN
jgi:hypothetical protein